jgi:hypothetical protein
MKVYRFHKKIQLLLWSDWPHNSLQLASNVQFKVNWQGIPDTCAQDGAGKREPTSRLAVT